MARSWTLATVWLLMMGCTALVGPVAQAAAAPAYTTPDPGWWETNGRVTDSLVMGGRVYLAGGFDYVGPVTGYGVGVDTESGRKLATTPLVNGTVRAAASDGAGGWYIVGSFTSVGGVYRRGAAQIDARGAVTAWNPAPRGSVLAVAADGDRVFLGGLLSQVGAVAVGNVAAVDRNEGQVLRDWSPTTNGQVNALLTSPTGLYAAGAFTTVNGAARTGLVRLSTVTGAVDPRFRGRTTGPVRAVALSGDQSRVYAGGSFTAAVGAGAPVLRTRLAAFDTGTGSVLAWNPRANAEVRAIAVDRSSETVYVGGTFSLLGTSTRYRVGGVTRGGRVTSFGALLRGCHTPHRTKYAHSYVPCSTEVDALAVAAGRLYVGGRFTASAGISRHNAVALTLNTSTPAAWNPIASGPVLALAPSGTTIFVGGNLTSVGGLVRRGLAALDARTGVGIPGFQADANNLPLDLEASPDGARLYVAGSFTRVRGVVRDRLAALSPSTGAVSTDFVANTNNSVLAVRYAGTSLFAAGQFTTVRGVKRSHVAKLNPVTGAVDARFLANTSGPPGALRRGGMVQGLAVRADGSRVFLGGPFTSVNGRAVGQGLAVVDGITGSMLGRQLSGVTRCRMSGPWIVSLTLSPDGRRLYGGDVCPDSIYQWDAVNLSTAAKPGGLNWHTWCNAGMQAALEVDGRLYYGSHGGNRGKGGYCWASPTDHTTVARQRFAVFAASTGVLAPDSIALNAPMGVWSITKLPQGLLVGGDFTFVEDRQNVRQGLALFPATW